MIYFDEEVLKALRRKSRKESPRHILKMETDLSQEEKVAVFGMAERLRKAKNELTQIMEKRIEQLRRLRRYRGILKALERCGAARTDERARLVREMEDLRREMKVTKEDCRKAMISICRKYDLPSVFGATASEDVWQGVEQVLFGKGKRLHYAKRGELPGLRAKERNRIIVMKPENGTLSFRLGNLKFGFRKKAARWDRFEKEEIFGVLAYLENADEIDREAAALLMSEGLTAETSRPCYATLVCSVIRGKPRVFVHITIEGKPSVKMTESGDIRHLPGKGRIGADIGVQTIAWTSRTETGIDNLAVRGEDALKAENRLEKMSRQMERSRRMSNPQNYNADGTVKRGVRLSWKYSKRYLKLRKKRRELERKCAVNRRLAANETANHLRTLGDDFITEPKNAGKLARRAKQTTYGKRGRPNRKKRFGKSIRRRAPGYLQEKIRQVFERSGGTYREVPPMYRASQFDHTDGSYHRKPLRLRAYDLSDGSFVLRDWHASFNLYCADDAAQAVDPARCAEAFPAAHRMQLDMIGSIVKSGKKILNSGIAPV